MSKNLKKTFNKNRRNLSDFYTFDDRDELPTPELNLTIEHFDDTGVLKDPKPPCVASDIDPQYKTDCDFRQAVPKFLVKSDIIALRDVARTKFYAFSDAQRVIRKQAELDYNARMYEKTMQFYEHYFKRLNNMEKDSFDRLKHKYNELKELKSNKLEDKYKNLQLEHHRVYTKLFETFGRFQFLLMVVINYNRITADADEKELFEKRTTFDLLSDMPAKYDKNERNKFELFMNQYIRPQIMEKENLSGELWQKGYENLQHKVFDYNCYLTDVSLKKHGMSMVYQKYMEICHENHQRRLFFKNANFLKERTKLLKTKTAEVVDNWEEKRRQNIAYRKVEAILEVMVAKLGLKTEILLRSKYEKESALDHARKIQEYLLNLLYELDSKPPELVKSLENEVRLRVAQNELKARKSLLTQIRMENLLSHYKNHYKKKNIVSGYTTLIKRPHSKYTFIRSKSESCIEWRSKEGSLQTAARDQGKVSK